MNNRFYKLTIKDIPVAKKTILLRADYNVPLTTDGKVSDDYRLRMSLPTIERLLKDKCKIVIISHLGRPEGKINSKYSLEPVAKHLSGLLNRPVEFINECIGQKVYMNVKKAPLGSVILLENLRFHPEEEANSFDFASQLAKQSRADYFVQDGFGVVHRAHASTSAITQFLPSVAGLLLEREYLTITEAMKSPQKPLVAVMGGAKVSDKISVIDKLVDVADNILIGGAMANTFLAYKGYSVGYSKVESDQGDTISNIYKKISDKVGEANVDSFLVLPTDVGVGTSLDETATRQDVVISSVPSQSMALDIGPETSQKFADIAKNAHTVIWNGTLGYAESPSFATGSVQIASVLADNKNIIKSIIGGGDTADFVIHWDKLRGGSFSHVSTGGGASLELMAGYILPGIEVLLDSGHNV